jgi:amidase
VSCGSGFGVLAAEKLKDTHAYYSIKDGIIFGPNLDNIPACPIIGTIGTWPKEEHLTVEPAYYGGNLDTIYITQGSISYLPVSIDGGMFFAGDIHALQGAGETHGGGMECAGKIDVTFSVIKNISFPTPLIKTSEEIIVLATDFNFDKAMQQAAGKMVSIVQQLNDFSKEDALIYCSLLGHLRIGQVVNPRKTAAFALKRQYLKKEIF